ncbi:MAG: sigma-70 family RNA polymerase sigma factor [Oscillospiraceae bacterium]|nr:sigma-70 family RNA polymerase sigma factor [Oscillospiraceae bacterium]
MAQRKQIEELYMEMYDKLMAYACSCLASEALAEEAVQETFHIACKKSMQLCCSSNPQGWLVLTLKNTIRNMQSHRAAMKKLVERYMLTRISECSYTEDKIQFNILYEDVTEMDEFKLLSEMVIEGKSHQEMAEARGITVSACKKRVQRAKEALQKKIND